MPMHQRVCDAPGYVYMQRTIVSSFPSDKYARLSSPNCREYVTGDGVHLKPLEAIKYAKEISKQLVENGFSLKE